MKNIMKILMVGNIASVNSSLTEELRNRGHHVVLVANNNTITSGSGDFSISWSDLFTKKFGDDFDIIHISSPNLKKFLICFRYFKKSKVVCHWRGSDLRLWYKTFPVRRLFFHIGNVHLYSTIDLHFWLKDIPREKKYFFRSCVDTEKFKPFNIIRKKEMLTMDKGDDRTIPHDDMPKLFNEYKKIRSHNYLVDDRIPSVTVMEAVACGCQSVFHPWMTRKWVIEHASVKSQTDKLISIYRKVIG